jgi:hypothetical protein
MKIFEFSFNPKRRRDRFFGAYFFEPKSTKEKAKGALYVIGQLDNALEFNSKFLKTLAETIRQEYYSSSLEGAANCLKASLKTANAFLATQSKKGNVDWLGNLHIAVLLLITVKEKKTVFHLAKTGNTKIFVTRQKMLLNVGKNLETRSLQQPGKVFGNLTSGTIAPNDSVLVASAEIFNMLSKEESFAQLGIFTQAKHFREFFAKRARMLSKTSAVLVSFVIEKEQARRALLKKTFLPAFPKPRIIFPQKAVARLAQLQLQFPWLHNSLVVKRKVILVLLLAALLLFGYFAFG